MDNGEIRSDCGRSEHNVSDEENERIHGDGRVPAVLQLGNRDREKRRGENNRSYSRGDEE